MLEPLTEQLQEIRGRIEQRRRALQNPAFGLNPCGEIELGSYEPASLGTLTLFGANLKVGDKIIVGRKTATIISIVHDEITLQYALDCSEITLQYALDYSEIEPAVDAAIREPPPVQELRPTQEGRHKKAAKPFSPPFPQPKQLRSQIQARGAFFRRR